MKGCKNFSYFPFHMFGSPCFRSCSPSLSIFLAMFSSLSMDINGLFGMHCNVRNYKLHMQNQCNLFYFSTWRYGLIRKCITTLQLFASSFFHWEADKKCYLICNAHRAHRAVFLGELNTRNICMYPVTVGYFLERLECFR